MGLKNTIKSLDYYGHPIKFNFNKNGDTHNTLCGGIISILIRLTLFTYITYLAKKMIRYENDILSL